MKFSVSSGLMMLLCSVLCGGTEASDTAASSSIAEALASTEVMPPTYAITLHLIGMADRYQAWPGSKETWHYGEGYIEPFGPAQYYCGMGFPEEKDHPLPDWAKGMFQTLSGKPEALFCIYQTHDGLLFAWDAPVGARHRYKEGAQNDRINLIVGGTGAFKGVTGLWNGSTEYRGKVTQVIPGHRIQEMTIKVMQGYVQLPEEKK